MVASQLSQVSTSRVEQEQKATSWQQRFLQLLPGIQKYAHRRFRQLAPEAREDATAEVIASSLVSFARLVTQGREDRAYVTALARYGVAQYRAGRRVGNRLNVRDVGSEYCHREKGVTLERLDRFEFRSGHWQEVLVEDRRSGPAEVAVTRMDFAAWLESLPSRTRQVAQLLASGESNGHVARVFHVTASRVSQLRSELYQSWHAFQDESAPASILA